MNTFPVIIDGRTLFNNVILVTDTQGNAVTGDWISIGNPVTLHLEAGEYRFSSQATVSGYSFTVAADGSIVLQADTAEFMQVINGNVLKLMGYSVKVDARYITGDGICFPTAHVPAATSPYAGGFIKNEQFNLMPGLAYYIQTSSGMVSNFFLRVNMIKEWEVLNPATMQPDSVYDGFITRTNGAYVPELVIYGYPFLIDGRSAKCPLRLIDLAGTAAKGSNHAGFDDEGVFFANLIPQRRTTEGFTTDDLYRFQTERNTYSEPGFYIDNDGTIGFDALYGLYFTIDRFNGITRLNVVYPLPDRIE